MQTVYRLNVAELSPDFIEGLKIQFRNKEIKIIVTEADDTDYIMSSPEYRAELLERLRDIEEGRNSADGLVEKRKPTFLTNEHSASQNKNPNGDSSLNN